MIKSDFLKQYASVRRGYTYEEQNGIGIFSFPVFSRTGLVRHGFTARKGGASTGPFASLNMSFTRETESRDAVMENHRLFCRRAGVAWESMVMDNFEHGVAIEKVNASHRGMGYLRPPLPHCDGLITDDPGTTLVTGHADCVPLYAIDPVRNCIGLAHAGWKGAIGKIAVNMIELMLDTYACKREHLLAGIGPCICGSCFEVSEDLAARFVDAFPGVPLAKPGKADRPDKAYVDLPMACVAQFLQAGLPAQNISLMDVCTYEDPERLYSHRRDQGNTGGMAAFLQLLPEEERNREGFLQSVTPAVLI